MADTPTWQETLRGQLDAVTSATSVSTIAGYWATALAAAKTEQDTLNTAYNTAKSAAWTAFKAADDKYQEIEDYRQEVLRKMALSSSQNAVQSAPMPTPPEAGYPGHYGIGSCYYAACAYFDALATAALYEKHADY